MQVAAIVRILVMVVGHPSLCADEIDYELAHNPDVWLCSLQFILRRSICFLQFELSRRSGCLFRARNQRIFPWLENVTVHVFGAMPGSSCASYCTLRSQISVYFLAGKSSAALKVDRLQAVPVLQGDLILSRLLCPLFHVPLLQILATFLIGTRRSRHQNCF
jgi:hypothetical protein